MDKDLGLKISVVSLKVIDVNVVVYGRDDADSRLQVYRRCDYISCVMDHLLTLDDMYLSTTLGEFDVFYQLPNKHLNSGYSPMPADKDRQVGVMSEKWCSTGTTPSGKDSRAKQVWTAYFLSI
jgi:hypothetical protein